MREMFDKLKFDNVMKKIFFFTFIIFIVLAGQHNCFAGKKDTIAVIDFEGQNVSAMDAVVVTSFLRTALVNNAFFEVTDRNNMEKILGEQGLQQTGCTTEDCAVKIGNLLNVQKIIIGNLSKLGNTYYATANIVDVETGRIVISDRVKSHSQSELDVAMETLAKRLEAKSRGEKITAEVSKPQILTQPQVVTQPQTPMLVRRPPAITPQPRAVRRETGSVVLGIGASSPGVSVKLLMLTSDKKRSGCFEFKYQSADGIPVIGLRLRFYVNRNKLVLFYLGGEVDYTFFDSDICKVRGGIGEPFIGVEFFAAKFISLQFDMGPAFYILKDVNYGVSIKGYELCGNVEMTFYFTGF